MMVTRKAFHEELDELRDAVGALGQLAIDAVEHGTTAFLDADVAAAEAVIAGDRLLDARMAMIESRSCELLARQQPMAVDLRTVLAILRIVHELERCGDYMVNIAKAARRLYPHALSDEMKQLITRMREQAVVQLRAGLDAFARNDVALGEALADMDDVMDDLQKELLRLIFATRSGEEDVQEAVQTALVGRYFERIADHAVNVGERVAFMVSGVAPGAIEAAGDLEVRSEEDPPSGPTT